MESIIASDLKEHGTFMLPALATFFRRELPAREAVEEKIVCGRRVHIPARGTSPEDQDHVLFAAEVGCVLSRLCRI